MGTRREWECLSCLGYSKCVLVMSRNDHRVYRASIGERIQMKHQELVAEFLSHKLSALSLICSKWWTLRDNSGIRKCRLCHNPLPNNESQMLTLHFHVRWALRRDCIAEDFYHSQAAVQMYLNYAQMVVSRRNSVNGMYYRCM